MGIGWISIRMDSFPIVFVIAPNRLWEHLAAVHLPGSTMPKLGWNLIFILRPHIAFVPFGGYSYHISEPPIGTDRNEFWGGVKFAVDLPKFPKAIVNRLRTGALDV